MFEDIKNNVLNGNQDPLVAYAELKDIERELKSTIDEVYEAAIIEAKKEDKTFQLMGYKFEVRNGKTSYSFKHIQKWNDLNDQRKEFEEICKTALKMGNKIQMANEDGEAIDLPTVTYSKDSLIVKKV